MRTLVIGDIHGGLRALHQIMERAKVTKTDTIIFLGDYVDGWSQSPQVMDFIIDLKSKQKCICMRGNHDDLLLDWLTETKDNVLWYKHGGEATVIAYKSVTEQNKQKHIEFLQSLDNFYLDEKHRLFVHAGFTNMNGVDFEYFPGLFYWDRTLWETALSLDTRIKLEDPFYPKRLTLYNEIYIGHTPVTRIGETTPVQKANIWNVDTGAGFMGPLTIMDVDTKEFWQSEPLNQLYFDEKGRN
jgi:serine/threonine protein phosphatase 1